MTDMVDPLKTSVVPEEDETVDGDVFTKKEADAEQDGQAQQAPDVFEELPIEIRSLTERYKAHSVASCVVVIY